MQYLSSRMMKHRSAQTRHSSFPLYHPYKIGYLAEDLADQLVSHSFIISILSQAQ